MLLFQQETNNLNAGSCHGFINGKQDAKAAEKHSVECIVLLTLVYYFELFGTL